MIPFYDKIIIEPIQAKTIIQTQDNNFIEKGVVKAIGRDVDFVKVGDTIFFESWGCIKTADGDYVVAQNNQLILGKDEG